MTIVNNTFERMEDCAGNIHHYNDCKKCVKYSTCFSAAWSSLNAVYAVKDAVFEIG
jgi:hypothetical protein